MRYNTFYVFLRLELKNFEKLIAPSESWGKNTSKSFGNYFFRYILALQTQAENSMISRSRAAPGELTWNASYAISRKRTGSNYNSILIQVSLFFYIFPWKILLDSIWTVHIIQFKNLGVDFYVLLNQWGAYHNVKIFLLLLKNHAFSYLLPTCTIVYCMNINCIRTKKKILKLFT